VPPNQRMQPDAVPATEIVPIFCGIIIPNAIPIAGCGAADAPGVGPVSNHSCPTGTAFYRFLQSDSFSIHVLHDVFDRRSL
jgi:hypothetical protein